MKTLKKNLCNRYKCGWCYKIELESNKNKNEEQGSSNCSLEDDNVYFVRKGSCICFKVRDYVFCLMKPRIFVEFIFNIPCQCYTF